MKVLIAYATKHGSTAEVAHGIAETLRRDRFDVDVVEARHVHRVSGYDGVIVGGSIYVGKWHPDALGLVNRHADEMKRIPVAIFALGPKTLEEHDIATSRAQLDAALAKATNIHPERIAIFGGVIDPSKVHFPFNRMPASDARDWNTITAWALEFGTIVRNRSVVPTNGGSAATPMNSRLPAVTIDVKAAHTRGRSKGVSHVQVDRLGDRRITGG